MEHHRGKAERSLVTATIITLMLAVSPAHAQSSPQASKDADIDTFLANLERKSAAQAQAQAPAAPAPVRREAVAPTPTQADASPMAIDPLPQMQATPMLPESPPEAGPFRTLLLMIGGIAICALATVGLTLTFFALRKDMKRKKHARRRRFGPFDPEGAVQAAHR